MKKALKLFLTSIISLSTITACGNNTQLQNFQIPQTEQVNDIQALSRKSLGKNVYNNFKINPELPKADKKRKAVKLTMLLTDDKTHQSPWSEKMLKMMDDIKQDNVHNIVFRDGNEHGDSRLYYIQGDNDPNTVRSAQSTLAPGIGEVQSNNPKVFSEILGWTLNNYPAQRRFLQIYTHGGGVFGIGTDKHQTDMSGKVLDKDSEIWMITPQDFTEALKQGLKGRKLDLIYFRACLMGNLEALYELRGSTDYVIASEDVSYSVENSNLTMTKLFDDLAGQGISPDKIAKQMSIAANAKQGSRQGYTTIAAIDINKLTNLKSAINTLANTLRKSLKTDRETILAAYDAVPTIKGNLSPEKYHEHMRDLWGFTSELYKRTNSSTIKKALDQVRNAQTQAMLHDKDSFGSSANGLSIFMPTSDQVKEENNGWINYLKNGYRNRRFAKDTGWDEFLLELLLQK